MSFLDAVFYQSNFDSFSERVSEIRENLPEGFFSVTVPKKK